MKKAVICSLLFLLLLAFGASSASGETTTLLVYLCVSEDMEEMAYADLVEIAEVEAGDSITAVVLAGGLREWEMEDLKGNSRTLTVIRDGYLEEADDWGQKSMGSPESLKEFLSWGIKNYPADRTIAVLWDHGAGSEGGLCFDETANDDGLTLVEINDVLGSLEQSNPGWHINIFGCDACLMGTYEMAALLSHYNIDYYVGSEELEPGNGWDYASWLETLKNNPAISDEDLCGVIVDSFVETGLKEDPDDYMTLSAVRLSEMDALERSMEEFAAVMTGQIRSGNLASVRQGRSRLFTFGSFDDASWDTVDLGAALDIYAQFDPDKAAEAKRCLSKAVCACRQTDNLDPCCGLSVMIPQDTAADYADYRDGCSLTGTIPNWCEFIDGYVSELQGGSCQINCSGTCQIQQDTIQGQGFLPSYCTPYGCMSWDDESGSYSEEDIRGEEIAIRDSDQGFTATLPQEELPNLDSVEGMLLMDFSEDGMEYYVELGTMQNNLVDWNTGTVVSLFDGSWPVFGGQPVPMYDQTSNANSRRSLIPVRLNGEYTYLVVVFPAGGTEGKVIGANAGYDSNGLPIRNMTKLKPGDEIVPVYVCYYEEEGRENLQDMEYLGEKILWADGMTVTYEDLCDEEEPIPMLFCFLFNDIFGEETMSEIISFEI